MTNKQIVIDNMIYHVVASVRDDEDNKDYVVYTEDELDKDEVVTLHCVQYYLDDGVFVPIKIKSKKDKETAVKIIDSVMERINNFLKKK